MPSRPDKRKDILEMYGSEPPPSKDAIIFTLAFRPFFLAAGIWSVLAITLWIALLISGQMLPSRFDPLTWHIHEMLFGFVPAAIAGFLLTAIPNWTGRVPLQGAPLVCLVGLWLIGRIVCLISSFVPLWLAAVVDVAFPAALFAVAAQEIIAARNWRNLLMPVPVALLGVADLLMFLERAGCGIPAGLGWRLGLSAIIILVSVVGTRIIPPFTHNWLLARGIAKPPIGHGMLDRMALGILHAGLIGWSVAPTFRPFGVLLILAATLNFLRLVRWRGKSTFAEPLLFSLHVGYFWLIVGAALLGTSMLDTMLPFAAAIHALTVGAMGTMILAVMTRVSLGHTGRRLEADRLTTFVFLMVNGAAVMRIAAALPGSAQIPLLDVSAALWVASFALFALRYGQLLIAARVR